MQKELILPYFDLKEAKRILLASAKLQLSTKSRRGDANMLDDARMGEFVRQEVI